MANGDPNADPRSWAPPRPETRAGDGHAPGPVDPNAPPAPLGRVRRAPNAAGDEMLSLLRRPLGKVLAVTLVLALVSILLRSF